MTIEDQIKDEKLQYDINREAAKISALSSGKIDKYEYLTAEEILPSNQQQIIQQAKFAYSPLGKALEKQIKTIEDQGKKQVKAIQDNKQLVNINKDDDDYKYKPLVSKEREIFKDIDKIEELSNKIDYDNLKYVVVGTGDKYLNIIRIGNKHDNQKRTLANINMFHNARDNAIKFFQDYGGMILKAKKLAREQE